MNREATLSRRVLADKRKAENAKSYQMIFPDDSDMMVAYIKFKVFDGVYEGQEHVMEFKFKYGSNIKKMYPLDPPMVTFKTPIYHANIGKFPGGVVCLDTIKQDGQWIPTCGIPGMIQIIKALLICPNTSSPQNGEAGSCYDRLIKEGKSGEEQWKKTCQKYYNDHKSECDELLGMFPPKELTEFEENKVSKKRFEDSSESSSESSSDSSIEIKKKVKKYNNTDKEKKSSKKDKKDKKVKKDKKSKKDKTSKKSKASKK